MARRVPLPGLLDDLKRRGLRRTFSGRGPGLREAAVGRLRVKLESNLVSTLPNSARRTTGSVREAQEHPPEHDLGRRQNWIWYVHVRTRGRNI
jgi:hypothetical protein